MSVVRASAADYWMELLRGDHGRSLVDSIVEATEIFDLRLEGHPYVTVLRPLFVDPETVQTATAAATIVHAAIRTAAARLLHDDQLRHSLGFARYLDALLELDRRSSRAPIRCRLDGMFDDDGRIQFIELNTQPTGPFLQFEAGRALASASIGRAFGARFPFTVVDTRDLAVDAIVDEHRALGHRLPVRVGVIRSFVSYERWASYAASRGIDIVEFDAARLEVRSDAAFVDGKRIDLVALSFNELFAQSDDMQPLLDALRRGIVTPIFGVSQAILCNSKLTFELLSAPEHADLFDHETQRALRQHVPWTRYVRERRTTIDGRDIDLLPFLAEHRERFVLKPAGSKGGEGVVLGWLCDAARWEQTLSKAAARRPYVAQERVRSTPQLFPRLRDGQIVDEACSSDFNPFIWNGARVEGFTSRVAQTKTNVSDGAGMAAVFLLHA